ncbi:hypothetical protein BC826DRAFT_1053154 [Russula brevipes]|nr:hypothetical protein BC826DRAFT_1053154 [Russula brevipes]
MIRDRLLLLVIRLSLDSCPRFLSVSGGNDEKLNKEKLNTHRSLLSEKFFVSMNSKYFPWPPPEPNPSRDLGISVGGYRYRHRHYIVHGLLAADSRDRCESHVSDRIGSRIQRGPPASPRKKNGNGRIPPAFP